MGYVKAEAYCGLRAAGCVGCAGRPRRKQANQRLSARFNLGPLTIDEAVTLPRSQAAVNAGLITEEQLRFSYAGFDRNQNGTVCAQLSHGFEVNNRPFGEFFYNFADDNASVPAD